MGRRPLLPRAVADAMRRSCPSPWPRSPRSSWRCPATPMPSRATWAASSATPWSWRSGGSSSWRRRAAEPSGTPISSRHDGAYELGRGEARSGRTMDALLAAYRVGARVSWRDLSAPGSRRLDRGAGGPLRGTGVRLHRRAVRLERRRAQRRVGATRARAHRYLERLAGLLRDGRHGPELGPPPNARSGRRRDPHRRDPPRGPRPRGVVALDSADVAEQRAGAGLEATPTSPCCSWPTRVERARPRLLRSLAGRDRRRPGPSVDQVPDSSTGQAGRGSWGWPRRRRTGRHREAAGRAGAGRGRRGDRDLRRRCSSRSTT